MKRKMQKLAAQLAGILIVLLGVTLLSFSLMYIAPGDPARTILQAGGTMPSGEAVQEKREEMGLNRPFLEQYGSWLWDFTHGDLGISMIDGRDVSGEVTKALGKIVEQGEVKKVLRNPEHPYTKLLLSSGNTFMLDHYFYNHLM